MMQEPVEKQNKDEKRKRTHDEPLVSRSEDDFSTAVSPMIDELKEV
jgi:hypothetical protein